MHSFTLAHTISLAKLLGYGVCSLALSPNGQLLAIGGQYGEVYICDIDALERLIKLPYADEEYGGVNSVAFNARSSLLASVTNEGTLNVWDILRQRPYALWQPMHQEYVGDSLLQAYHHVHSLLFHHDGSQLFGGGDGGIYCWDVDTGLERNHLDAAQESILSLALDHSGRWLTGAGWKNHIYLWDLITGAADSSLSPATYRVDCVSFSPDGRILISGGSGEQGGIEEDRPSDSLHLWSVQSLQPLRTLQTPSRWVSTMSWHPSRTILATGASYANITLWDSTTWEIMHILRSECHYLHWVCFHPGKPWLLCAGATANHLDYRLEIWQYEV